MIDYNMLGFYMTSVWRAIDDAKASIKKLGSFIDSLEDEDCRETLKAYCAKMGAEIENAEFYAVAFDWTLSGL